MKDWSDHSPPQTLTSLHDNTISHNISEGSKQNELRLIIPHLYVRGIWYFCSSLFETSITPSLRLAEEDSSRRS